VLLALLLGASLLVIAAAAMAPNIAMQIKRDREEELIHRGMQYRRAIHTFAKRTGHFPLRLEELENTNGTRYLRKRYKDPISGKDFRLLHMADIAATGARLNTASPPTEGSADASTSQSGASPDASSPDAQADQTAPAAGVAGSPAAQLASSSAGASEFGGGVIYGVVSPSSKKSIREFDHKSHYNQWLFFYSTIYDGSVEVRGPTPLRPVFAAQASSNSTNSTNQTPAQSSAQQQ
jgi:type II secretory pathway pseudopilin PulG